MLSIRQAKIEDINSIYDLEVMCFKDPYPKRLLFTLLALYPELFLVIEYENKIVGYVVGIVRKDSYGHVISLCIHPMYRRRGFGTRLVNSLERSFTEKFNICKYRLEVRISNTGAINLYRELGYKITNTISNYYPDGEDAYIMTKDVCENITE